ncbi:MAG: hypothetical protein AAB815_00555 [Patescibacteria group bacterium]
MKSETKNCQNCKKDFTIEPEDFNFYEKIHVPPPTWCPECRQQRRYAWRNERTLYRRNCDLCGKSTVTIYSPNKDLKVYCNECWWGDGWDPASYGRDFDFSRPFFEQYREMQREVPRMALLNKRSVNSEYTNHSGDNKNVYLSFSIFQGENIYYSNWMMNHCRECIDSSFLYEAGERLYEVINSRKSYECQYGMQLQDCVNCYYSYDLRGCSDCFLSHNLRNKKYCFKNMQYSREEYLNKMKDYNLGSYAARAELFKAYKDMIQGDAIHRFVVAERIINSSGNFLFDCKNVKDSFEVNASENCKNIYGSPDAKDCWDLYHAGFHVELCYELQGCTATSNCQFCHLCYDNMNVMYSDTCQNSQNLFGCISVKKGEYMILNKKYSKKDYEELKAKIIEHMKKTGEYGEFFPIKFAPVCYNETQGNLYVPMSKEEVLRRGWQWENKMPGTFGKETIKPEDIPDNIKDVQNNITKEILHCANCNKNYNIVPFELSFYRRENIPIPHFCPDCRYKARIAFRLPRKLWVGKCKCTLSSHNHSGHCSNEFMTSYSPDRPEKVYCESCYNKEVY